MGGSLEKHIEQKYTRELEGEDNKERNHNRTQGTMR